jgi:probable H4MPT-linked C1 transfer pathway protein
MDGLGPDREPLVSAVLGFDVGGANVKAALAGQGPPRTFDRPFALFREPEALVERLSEGARALGGPTPRIAVTMTAELCDCFRTKREGVAFVLGAVEKAFPEADARTFGFDGRFHSPDAARRRPLRVAAANWMATARLVAETLPDVLLVDCGSTTTDLIPIVGGRVAARGRTDPGRLRRGELVYTGVLRTPVCAIVRSLPLKGRRSRVAAELFAIAADAHRFLGSITEAEYSCETPDGRGRSREESGARLARMVCADTDLLSSEDVAAIAAEIARSQVRDIVAGIREIQRGLATRAPRTAVVAGSGAVLARRASEECGLEVLPGPFSGDLGRVAPALAVALLLGRETP